MVTNQHIEYLSNLPPDWRQVPIVEIGDIYSGSTPSRTQAKFWGGTIAWVTPGELTNLNQKWLTQTKETITDLGLAKSSIHLLPVGTILVTTRATIGYVALAGISVTTNQGFKNIVPNTTIDPNFYFHLLKYITPEMERLASGSTFNEISRRNFAAIIVPRPEPDEQNLIAAVLDSIDDAIRYTERLIDKLKQVRAGLLHDLLTYGIDENGELRNSVSHPEQFRESELGLIPIDWRVNSIGSMCRYVTYGFTNPMPTTSEGPWMVTATDVGEGKIDYQTARHTDPNAYERLITAKSKPNIGDILITKDGTLGRVATVDKSDICINQSVACLRLHDAKYAPFISCYLRSPLGQERMLADAGGSTIKHLYITKLSSLLIPLPPDQELEHIEKLLSFEDNRLNDEGLFLAKLRQIKKGLTDDLLTGRIRVSALLENEE